MKISVNFYQNEISYQFDAEVKDSVNHFTGTALNQLFNYVSLAKKVGASTFKFNQPINLSIVADGVKYDTGTCDQRFQSKLKCQRSSKGMATFSKRVFSLIKYSTNEVVDVSMNDVLEDLE